MKALFAALVIFAATSAHAAQWSCHIDAFMLNFDKENSPRITVELMTEEVNGALNGTVTAFHPRGTKVMNAPVTKTAHQVADNDQLKKAIASMGLGQKVVRTQEFIFGKASHMGILAGVYRLYDSADQELDQLVFVFGADGFASCAQHKQIWTFDYPLPH